MGNIIRFALLACTAYGALLALQPQSLTARAQELSSGNQGLEEVVVTARRVEEKLQAVPIAVTAFTAKDLQEQQILNFGDIGNKIPNFDIQQQFGEPATPLFILRGFATGDLNPSVDSPIGLYIDGVYLGRAVGAAFDIADLERLEVERGPQGTLFGRNSEGGAVNFITAKPTGEFGGHLETTFGDYGQARVKGTVNLPESNGLSARITVLHDEHDGYVRNLTPGRTYNLGPTFGTISSASDFGGKDETAVFAAVRYVATDDLTFDYTFDYTSQTETELATQLLGFDNTPTEQLVKNTIFGTIPLGTVTAVSTSRLDAVPLDFTSPGHLEVLGHSLTVQYDLNDNIRLKSIAAYRSMREDSGGNDIDGSAVNVGVPFNVISSIARRAQHQWSEEAQVIGSYERFNWLAGFFWFQEHGFQNGPVFVFRSFPGNSAVPLTAADFSAGSIGTAVNTSLAAYLHSTYHLTDEIDISGGVRDSNDDRYFQKWTPPGGSVALAGYPLRANYNHWDGDATLTYKFLPDVNAYARFATGYLSGGILATKAYSPEVVKSYELGLKSEWYDHRLRLNLAGFYEHRRNIQIETFDPSIGTFIDNFGSANLHGLEFEATAVPINGLTLTANLGWITTPSASSQTGGAPARSLVPPKNLSLSAEYEFPKFENGMYASARLDANWVDDHYEIPFALQNTALDQQAAIAKANWLVNARVSLLDIPVNGGQYRARVSLWARNLLDSHELEFSRDLGLAVVGNFQIPRTFGADLAIDF